MNIHYQHSVFSLVVFFKFVCLLDPILQERRNSQEKNRSSSINGYGYSHVIKKNRGNIVKMLIDTVLLRKGGEESRKAF